MIVKTNCETDGSSSALILTVQLRAPPRQQLEHLHLAVLRGVVQRCPARAAPGLQVPAVVEQQPRYADEAVTGCPVQGGGPVVVGPGRVRAHGDVHRHLLVLPRTRRDLRRASNKPSRRFHNHGDVESTYQCFRI